MYKIVYFCIPAYGHTNPTLEVVRELVSRGHEVRYYSYELFREAIEETGAKFISCDRFDAEFNLSKEDGAKIGKDIALSTKVLVDTTLSLDDIVCKEMEYFQPDCIVADSMAVWGKALAMKLGIPFISSTTTFAFNKESAKVMKQSLADLLKMLIAIPKIQKDIKRLQDKGYPINNILDIIQNDNDTNTIVYTSPEFQPCAETFSDKYTFVGPVIRKSDTVYKKGERKLIYISLGTVNTVLMSFYKNCIKAFADSEYDVLMSVGKDTDISKLGEVPENIVIEPFVDQIAVLKATDVFITHCGMNSVSEALYFGVPLVMFPQTAEQGGVANRTEELGAGLFLKKNSTEEIRYAVNEVLSDTAYKKNAEIIADGFHRCGGAMKAADAILELIAKKR